MDRIGELGAELSRDYAGEAPLLVCVLRGAYVFLTDLARAVNLPVEIDFIAVSSYGSSTRTSGVVRLVKDLDVDLSGRHVILVEDMREAKVPSFDEVKPQLSQRLQAQQLDKYFRDLRAKNGL